MPDAPSHLQGSERAPLADPVIACILALQPIVGKREGFLPYMSTHVLADFLVGLRDAGWELKRSAEVVPLSVAENLAAALEDAREHREVLHTIDPGHGEWKGEGEDQWFDYGDTHTEGCAGCAAEKRIHDALAAYRAAHPAGREEGQP